MLPVYFWRASMEERNFIEENIPTADIDMNKENSIKVRHKKIEMITVKKYVK